MLRLRIRIKGYSPGRVPTQRMESLLTLPNYREPFGVSVCLRNNYSHLDERHNVFTPNDSSGEVMGGNERDLASAFRSARNCSADWFKSPAKNNRTGSHKWPVRFPTRYVLSYSNRCGSTAYSPASRLNEQSTSVFCPRSQRTN